MQGSIAACARGMQCEDCTQVLCRKIAELPFWSYCLELAQRTGQCIMHTCKKNKRRDLDQRVSGTFQSLKHDYMHRMRKKRVGTIVVNVTLRNQKYVQSGFQQK